MASLQGFNSASPSLSLSVPTQHGSFLQRHPSRTDLHVLPMGCTSTSTTPEWLHPAGPTFQVLLSMPSLRSAAHSSAVTAVGPLREAGAALG